MSSSKVSSSSQTLPATDPTVSNPDVLFSLVESDEPTSTTIKPSLHPTVIKKATAPDGYKGDKAAGVAFYYCSGCTETWAVVWKEKPRVSTLSVSVADYKKLAVMSVCGACEEKILEELQMAHEGYVRVEEKSEDWELV
ncbi:hypothetical protein H2204_002101 [Knufia peltigerae]|uniref:Uncharacterized protein n=1 Tax=Knufia peltigerae TaxID=1002370 RepID=A0AA38YD76_9EURO|nr:hypothetical protein H2204_002101 [Knufia peltigerae]